MYIGLHIEYPSFFSDCNEIYISSTYFRKKKSSNIKLHDNPSNGSRAVSHAYTGTDGQTDMTKIMVAFRKFCERVYTLKTVKTRVLESS